MRSWRNTEWISPALRLLRGIISSLRHPCRKVNQDIYESWNCIGWVSWWTSCRKRTSTMPSKPSRRNESAKHLLLQARFNTSREHYFGRKMCGKKRAGNIRSVERRFCLQINVAVMSGTSVHIRVCRMTLAFFLYSCPSLWARSAGVRITKGHSCHLDSVLAILVYCSSRIWLSGPSGPSGTGHIFFSVFRCTITASRPDVQGSSGSSSQNI